MGLGVAVELWFRWVREVCAGLGYPLRELRGGYGGEGRGRGSQAVRARVRLSQCGWG